MRLTRTRRRTTASAVAIVTAAALSLAACGSSNNDAGSGGGAAGSSASASGGGRCGTTAQTTLTVALWGGFDFDDTGLYKKYEQLCPNITIKQTLADSSGDYWTKLKTELAAGSGLPDVSGIEIGFVANIVQQHASQFVNFDSVPNAAQDKAEFYPFKWSMASTADGSDTVGLGTDTGPEAVCYRPDLLKQAGLPYQRDDVAKLWQTWPDFIKFGQKYEASSTKASGSHFLDSAASVFSTAVYQGKEAYDNAQGQPDAENSDGVKTAWQYATQAAADHITAGLSQFSTDWNKAFSGDSFAALACPTWMMSYIESQAGTGFAGKWDIAPVLPGGATNWGGSWLGVPTASKNQAAAIALVEWLSAKSQQVTLWSKGHWPSNQDAAQDPSVADAKNTYFSGAPVGQIFGGIASQMKIPPIGVDDTPIQTAFTTALTNIEQKGMSASDAWTSAINNVKQITG
jgi:cellobiose transport system substrate-binding protein